MRTEFEKLLKSVKAQCPDLITEEVFNDMMTQFDDGISKITADATAEGQALGFHEGYEEGKRVAADQAKHELEALTEKLDAEACEKLTSILAMLDENHTAKLQELYDYMQNNMIQKSEMETALAAQDEDYANKLETAYNAVCDDHACKLNIFKEAIEAKHVKDIEVIKEDIDKKYQALLTESINAIDENNTAKLAEVAKLLKEDKENALAKQKEVLTESFNKELNEYKVISENKLAKAEKALDAEKSRKLSILAEGVEKYLNYALEQYRPKSQLISEAKYNSALNTIAKVTDLLKVNGVIQETKDGVFADYEKTISEAKERENKLITEKIELKALLNKKEAQLVLEEKINKCTPSEGRFLRNYFKDASSAKVIEESIETAHEAFKKIQAERRAALQEEVKKSVSAKPSTVVTESKPAENESQKPEVISEQKEVAEKSQDIVDFYANVLKGQTK
jgi:hypothetical protein